MNSNTSSNDPNLMKSRVFIGHLPTDRISREDISQIFDCYGEIEAISILRGYAFVQYKCENDAVKAVQSEKGSTIKGSRVDIKMALEGKGQPNVSSEGGSSRGGRGGGRGGRGGMSRGRGSGSRGGRGGYDGGSMRDNFKDRRFNHSGNSGDRKRDYFESNAGYDDFSDRRPIGNKDVKCDSLILVLSPNASQYADMIERRLKRCAMLTHQRMISPHMQSGCVEDANRTGILFVVIVNSQNEMHQSITVNVLHGTPQEHINMPIDDAINMMTVSYEAYMDQLLAKKSKNTPPSERTAYLLRSLSEGKQVPDDDLESVITYLQSKKQPNFQQNGNKNELQQKILELFADTNSTSDPRAKPLIPQNALGNQNIYSNAGYY